MKVLVNCYACSPYKGSEPGMGWNFVRCLSKRHELHIITESKFKPELEKFFTDHPDEKNNCRFYFIKKERHKTLRIIWPPSYYWFYRKWQKKAYSLSTELDKKENFDIIHQLNMVGYREPGYLWKINKPFVWGPIGGFGITPWCMLTTMGLKGTVYYGGRNLMNIWQMYHLKRVKKAMAKASALISATKEQQDYIKLLYGKDSVIIPEVGLEGEPDKAFVERREGDKLRICWSGMHTSGKALNILLNALSKLSYRDIELHVLGEGTETKKWKSLALKLNLNNVIWHGWMERQAALELMRSCHLFCITSLKDLTSTVLLEALSYGMPVVSLDHCGFSNVITEKCGVKIAIKNKQQVVDDFTEAITEIAEDEHKRRQLAQGALERAEEYNWISKGETLNEIYETVSVQNL